MFLRFYTNNSKENDFSICKSVDFCYIYFYDIDLTSNDFRNKSFYVILLSVLLYTT